MQKRWLQKEIEFRDKWKAEQLEAQKREDGRPSIPEASQDPYSAYNFIMYQMANADGNASDSSEEEPTFKKYCAASSSKKPDGGEVAKEGKQIFDHESAAFQILSNELIALLKDGQVSYLY